MVKMPDPNFANATRLVTVLNEIAPLGKPVKVDSILGREVLITRVQFHKSSKGRWAHISFTDEHGEVFATTCGGKVIIEKLDLVIERLPLKAKIVTRPGGGPDPYFDIE
jgi:hypothetical protein